MSTHPNAILGLALTPDDLARKTYRGILEFMKLEDDEGDLKIGGENYHHLVMEDNYDDNWQLSGKEGQILVFKLITYGYGETILWDALVKRQAELESWAIDICERFKCSHEIFVTANYW